LLSAKSGVILGSGVMFKKTGAEEEGKNQCIVIHASFTEIIYSHFT